MTREDEIIKRIEQVVSSDGYVRKNIYTKLQFGIGITPHISRYWWIEN